MGRSTRKSLPLAGNGSPLHNRSAPAEAKTPAPTRGSHPVPPDTRKKHLGKAEAKRRLEADIFPECTPFLVLVVTVAFRVHYVIQPQNWWMVHPDEVYQSLEVAHICSYGYGFRSYEYSPFENSSDVTMYRQQELQAGMYALQSPIFPYFYVMLTSASRVLGAELHPYLLWRVAHAVVTSFLPLAVSHHAVKICQSKDVGSIAAILVASSVHLNVLGTHCFLHSFLSPVNFLALSLLTDSFNEECSTLRKAQKCVKNYGSASNGASSKHKSTRISNGKKVPEQKTFSNPECLDINGSHEFLYIQKNAQPPKPAATPGSATAKYETTAHSIPIHFFKALTSSFLLSLACYICPDACVQVLIHVCLLFSLRPKPSAQTVSAFFLGSASAFLVGAGADFAYYGRLELSPANWFRFNVVRNLATVAFGRMGTWTYIDFLFLQDFGTLLTSIFSVVTCCVLYLQLPCRIEQNNSVGAVTERVKWTGLAVNALPYWVVLFFIYSMSGCKETQHIHDCVVAVFVFIAVVLMAVRSLCQSKSRGRNLIRCIVAFFVVSQWQGFPDGESKLKWAHERTSAVENTNQCLHFISSQNDVTGVFIDHDLFMTGATTLLHHDVTIMYSSKGGYYEFGPGSRRNYTSDFNHLHLNGQVFVKNMSRSSSKDAIYSINEFTRASNYISESNAPSAASAIMLEPRYNYLLLRVDRRFVDYGFEEVFSTRQRRVLRRKGDPMSEHKLQLTAEKLPASEDASVVLQEADILFSMSQWAAAAARYHQAIHLDEQLVDAYPPLATCFTNMGDYPAARNVKGRCWSLFGQEACTSRRPTMTSL